MTLRERVTVLWEPVAESFPPAIVLNMDRDADRLAEFVAQNKPYLPGGCLRLSGNPPALTEKAEWSHIRNGSVGNVQGYREMLLWAYSTLGRSFFFTLEDDARIVRDVPIKELEQQLFRHNADVVYCLPHYTHHHHYGPVGLGMMLWKMSGADIAMRAWQPPIAAPSDVALVELVKSGALKAHVRWENLVANTTANPWVVDAGVKSTIV